MTIGPAVCEQVTLAVLVSGWAHVLHAVYKPWGAGSIMYSLQHGSLFVTSFVFLMVRIDFFAHGCASRQTTVASRSGVRRNPVIVRTRDNGFGTSR